MTFIHCCMPVAFALALLVSAPVHAAEDPALFVLTPALMQKLTAAEKALKALYKDEAEDAKDDGNDKSIEASIRKIDRDPNTLAVLARHGLTSRDLVLSAHALLHAGMFVSTEASMDKDKNAALYGSFTKVQQANIVLVRELTRPQ